MAEPPPPDESATPVVEQTAPPDEPKAEPMDIHKPKPVHNWREFLNEIVIIVIGVLIALGLEQAVESWHWHDEVTSGREHLREEIAFNERVYAHRLGVVSCVRANIAALKSIVANLRAGERVNNVAPFESPHNGPIQHEIWNSLTAAQVLVHFPKRELQHYGMFYQYREDAEYFMDRESRAWSQLHVLEGNPNSLSQPELNTLWVALEDAAEMNEGLSYVVQSQVAVGRALGIAIPADRGPQAECRPVVGAKL